ncbi:MULTISPECIES: isoprenylcysteine carboxyl methyltransferase family protein [unclassified Rummeliibacillus]|uniref:isoprenylcysteine carboxyl methyltransferase family protein n=1 Tax=unclassified Rummeliibacillus TaxID=2622809 RepID=UPI000E6658C1|nr:MULTISPECIES: isoprenylcysteine carboxylmethyltransferase family protein [unclassified Rummeliibacillus]RIJ63107.1 isoprenylcysteine carboxyl methyltransferase [Rummeliibacillus sp. POC4]RPJ94732.1 isoprenylcysteine carboxyl methyltransferase [Rummeliibacillus sp. TYF005]
MLFVIVFTLICIQRLVELRIAKRNEQYMKQRGAIEFGQSHYPFIVALHILFLCSLLLEYLVKSPSLNVLWVLLLTLFFLLQISRIWVIKSLGHFWNTKIIVLPNANLVKKGPYKWISHPNYVIVALEILVIPLIFQAYFTAVIFTILNMVMMLVRIPAEEAALKSIDHEEGNLEHL